MPHSPPVRWASHMMVTTRDGRRISPTGLLKPGSAANRSAQARQCRKSSTIARNLLPRYSGYSLSNLAVKCRSTGAWYVMRSPRMESRLAITPSKARATHFMCLSVYTRLGTASLTSSSWG